MGEQETQRGFWLKSHMTAGNTKAIGIDGRIIAKWVLEK
jgi:hypothetical protein